MGKTLVEIFGDEARAEEAEMKRRLEVLQQANAMLREERSTWLAVVAAIVLGQGGEVKILDRDILALGGPDSFQIACVKDTDNRCTKVRVELLHRKAGT
jgi:hypothetical protein